MESSLKSCHRKYLKVVEDSIREAQIDQSSDTFLDIEFGSQFEEGGMDMEKFVFVEYEDVAEPYTDPDHLHGNSEEDDTTNSLSNMPTNSENQAEIVANYDKRADAKDVTEAETKKVTDKSAEPSEIDNQIEENKRRAARVEATARSCPLGNEASGGDHFQILDWINFTPTIWTCKHSDVFNGDVLGPVEVPKISTESYRLYNRAQMPIVCGDSDVRDMRKMVADLVRDDDEEVIDNVLCLKVEVPAWEVFDGDDFKEDEYEFYEEVTDNEEVHSEGSDESFFVVKYPDTQVPK